MLISIFLIIQIFINHSHSKMTIDNKMKTKILSLFVLSVFTFVFLMSFANAAVDFTNVVGQTQSVAQGKTATVSFTLEESGYGNLTNMSFNVPFDLTSGANTLTSASSVTGMVTTLNQSVTSGTMTLTFNVPSTQVLGNYTGNLNLTGTYTSLVNYDIPISINVTSQHPQEILDCQTIGNPGNLEIKNIEFTNEGLQYSNFGEDDDSWFPFEEIEVEIEVKNDGNYDIDDVSVEWGIYSLEDGDWLIDIDEENEFNIKDGDKETFMVTFTLDDNLDIDLDEFVENMDNYRFYVVANGVIDDNDSPDDGEDTCAYAYESSTILIEDFVVLDNIDLPDTLSCGETVTVTADVWNIGDRDQDEVSVIVSGRESILGFNQIIEVGDIDEFDRQQISFTFTVPQNIDEKFYALKFEVNDEDGDVFENNDDDLSEFTVPFKVEGNCGGVLTDILVSASLESESKAGKEMTIKATITNNGNELRTFTVNAAEFASWAEFISQDQNTIVLDAGQSKNILFKFDIKRDVLGTQTFFIEFVSEDDVTRQPVSVNVEKAGSFLGITGLAIENTSLWGLGLLNLILVIVIIFVAIRIARRK